MDPDADDPPPQPIMESVPPANSVNARRIGSDLPKLLFLPLTRQNPATKKSDAKRISDFCFAGIAASCAVV